MGSDLLTDPYEAKFTPNHFIYEFQLVNASPSVARYGTVKPVDAPPGAGSGIGPSPLRHFAISSNKINELGNSHKPFVCL
jgi:hypothetical protein